MIAVNKPWILQLIRTAWPIIVILVAIGVTWGTQFGQVSRNTSDICTVKAVVDANKECIIRMETKLELMQTEMKADFNEIKGILRGTSPPH